VDIPQEWTNVLRQVIEKSGQQGLHVSLVLAGVKPGDWIEYLVPHTKWVIEQIERLIGFGAPLAFFSPQDVEEVKAAEFEDFSIPYEANDKAKIKDAFENPPFSPLKYHNTSIPPEIVELLRDDLTDRSLGQYFGFPDCCITAFELRTAGDIQPYTEHMWCAPDCAESQEIQKLYKDTLIGIFPWLPELQFDLSIRAREFELAKNEYFSQEAVKLLQELESRVNNDE
jgi:hypothetical protein